MSFDWSEYLDLARHLVDQPKGFTREAGLRSATSRAYYAAFCSARTVAKERFYFAPTNTGKDHGDVINHFRSLGMEQIAKKLGRMHGWRKQCDYDGKVDRLETIANSAIRYSTDVLKLLKWSGR
ncbi:MAG: hypothetical protein DRH70_06635 [Candidatus Coatesbacteria bacterium]|nr:MAG: hypothetical protein DRH70_06635 [Candidatus Coatesbacteria bacterium]